MGQCAFSSAASRYGSSHRGFVRHAQKSGTIMFVVLAIWVASGFAMVWPLIVTAVIAVKLAAHARRVYGPRPDVDEHEPEPEFTIV